MKACALVQMGTSHSDLVRNLPWLGVADPSVSPMAGGVLTDHEAVDLIGCQGYPLP